MSDISNYIERDLNLKSFNIENNKNYNNIKIHYPHAKADAIHCYQSIEKYLDKDKKILEVGGGYSFTYQFFTPRL